MNLRTFPAQRYCRSVSIHMPGADRRKSQSNPVFSGCQYSAPFSRL